MIQRCAVTEDLNRYLAQQEKDDAHSEAIEEIVTELMDKKGHYYPFTPDHVQEAICEMSADKWVTLTEVLRDELPTSSGLREVVEKYWTEVAERVAEEVLRIRIEQNSADAAADHAWDSHHD